MVHVVNRTGKDGSEDLEICEHGLEREKEKEQARVEGWRDGGWGGQKYPCELEPLIGGLEAGGTVIEADCGSKRLFFLFFFRGAYARRTCESVRRTHLEGGGG